jgi:sortase A
MKNKLTTILLILALFAGLSLLLYPTVSDYWNSLHASQAVADYAENVRNLEAEKYEQVLQDAKSYNQMLPYKQTTFALSEEEKEAYDALLDISGTGVMGYIEIPTVNISLPVYHGTEDAVLQIAVGHLEWSSLPVGGESTHCVLSGHRGLPSAKLFTNLDKLVAGDKFIMRVLDEVLTYEVDQILIVEPTDVSTLMIEAGKDLCTLVTCTPYGINSHRLLVRGHRIENQDEAQAIRVTSDAIQIEPLIVAPAVALPMLLVLLVILLVSGGKTKSAGGKKNAKTE